MSRLYNLLIAPIYFCIISSVGKCCEEIPTHVMTLEFGVLAGMRYYHLLSLRGDGEFMMDFVFTSFVVLWGMPNCRNWSGFCPTRCKKTTKMDVPSGIELVRGFVERISLQVRTLGGACAGSDWCRDHYKLTHAIYWTSLRRNLHHSKRIASVDRCHGFNTSQSIDATGLTLLSR